MSSPFDAFMAGYTPFFVYMAGEAVVYRPLANSGNDKSIKMLIDYGTWRRVFPGNAAREGEVVEVQFSGRNNTEGHTDPKIYIRDGQGDDIIFPSGHRLYNSGNPWYAVERLDEIEAGMVRVMIATKALPLHRMG